MSLLQILCDKCKEKIIGYASEDSTGSYFCISCGEAALEQNELKADLVRKYGT